MISTSTCLIVTGSALMPSTQAVSQGAGHSRPVNSGKLFVACSRSIASAQSSRQTRSFHSGMRLPSGQPLWQKGMPQSMQRTACFSMKGSRTRGGETSFQPLTRAGAGGARGGGGLGAGVLEVPFDGVVQEGAVVGVEGLDGHELGVDPGDLQ